MKNKNKELDVDFIGGQHQPITKEEENAISAFIRSSKEKKRSRVTRKTKSSQKLQQTA